MYKIDFNEPIHIHFIGIGGISMSGLAEILLKEGFTVSGSDTKESPLTKKLVSEGAHIIYGQKAENITRDIGCVVYTAAINRNNPENSDADPRRTARTAYEKLRYADRSFRNSRENNDNVHDLSYFTGRRSRPDDFSRRYFEGDRRKYPCRKFRYVYYGSM